MADLRPTFSTVPTNNQRRMISTEPYYSVPFLALIGY